LKSLFFLNENTSMIDPKGHNQPHHALPKKIENRRNRIASAIPGRITLAAILLPTITNGLNRSGREIIKGLNFCWGVRINMSRKARKKMI
jgi:hypothetical protein